MNWLIKNFLRGLVVVVPIALTVYLLVQAFTAIDRLLALETPGLGAAIIVAAVIAIGFLTANFVGRWLFGLMEKVFTKAPVVRLVYAAIKDLLEAFVGEKRRFDRPVVVTLTDEGGVRVLGFVTQDDVSALGMEGQVAVYVPFSYTWDGCLIFVPRERVEQLAADSASVMSMVVSGGVSRVSKT